MHFRFGELSELIGEEDPEECEGDVAEVFDCSVSVVSLGIDSETASHPWKNTGNNSGVIPEVPRGR